MVGHRLVEALRARDTDGSDYAGDERVGCCWIPASSRSTARQSRGHRRRRTTRLRRPGAGHAGAGVVIGGGLLGLEAANALRKFGLETHVVEMMPRLMAQQIDEAGGALLARTIAELGIAIHVGVGTESIESVEHSDVRLRLPTVT